MIHWPSSARSLQKSSKQKKTSRRFGFDRPQCEWLEPRLLLTADLSLAKAQIAPLAGGVPSAVTAGEMISYQITVANSASAGITAASNTTLKDILPVGETLVSASTVAGGSLSISGNTLTENLGTINAGSSVTVTIDALVNGQAGGTLSNSASVSTPDENGGLPIVSAPVSTTINALPNTAASLSITKTAANNNAAISAGGSETYTITVSNASANAAQNVSVSDVLPAGATFVSGTVSGGTGQTVLSAPTGNLETVNLGTLSAHGNATVTMTISAPNTAGVMVNAATVATTSGNTNVAGATAQLATTVQGTLIPPSGTVDLSISKTAPLTGSVNASETDTIVVTNNGTANANGVVVTDELPPQALFISGASSVGGVSVTNSNGLVSATLPILAAGASATLTITLTPTISGALTDSAYVEAIQPDYNQANNSASATVLVGGIAAPPVDLSVTKTASTPLVSAGSNETYTIVVANNSANTATGVTVNDLLPNGATFVSATDSLGGTLSPVNNAIADRLGTLAANSSATVTVTLKAGSVGVMTDTAYVTSDQLDTNLANNTAIISTPVQGTTTANVDLSITKTAANNNANIALGSDETYTLVVTNNGTSPATGVVVTDALPATATFVSGTTSINGVNVTSANGSVSANLGTLNAGQSATVTLTLAPSVAGSITDTAYVEADQIDVNQSNNVASVTTNVVSAAQEANLSIFKVATPNPVTAGQNLTYTLVVANTGAAAADNAMVSDTLPGGVTFDLASTDVNGVTVANNNGTLSANLGTVAAGAIDTITIVVTPTTSGLLSNTATVATTTTNASAHTSATAQTLVNPAPIQQADLSIYKIAAPNPGTVGQNETYVLVVVNTGTAAANNVNVTDNLPSGVTYVTGSTDVNGVTVSDNNGSVAANLGSVAPGAVDTLTIVVTPTQAGTLHNSATVSTTTLNSSTHTTASTDTTINPSSNDQANVSITKSASPSPGAVGQALTYTIVVSDAAGAADAAGVVVTDDLPASGIGSQVTARDVTRNVLLSDINGVITDSIGTLAAGTSDTITVTVTPTQTGTLTNTASVATTTSNSNSNTTATAQTTINPSSNNQANVSITKSASPSPGTVGQNLTYTIVVSDAAGAADAANVVVTDDLPATGIGTQVTARDVTRNVLLSDVNGVITDSVGTLTAGTSDTITVTVTPTQTGTLTNTASVATTTSNSNSNTTATAQTTINPSSNNQANVSITKSASPSPDTVGTPLTYTIVVSDAAGAADAANVVVTDNLPASGIGSQVTAQDVTRNVSLTDINGVISDSIGTLTAGTSDTITVTVTPTQTGTLTNTASVATTTSNSNSNTTATAQTTINPSSSNQANVSITKTASPSPAAVGQPLTYTIIVTDAAGAADAAGVVVTDTLPSSGIGAQITAQDMTRNVSLTAANGLITDNLGTLAAGTSDTITVTVTPTQTGTLTNTASVSTTTSNIGSPTSVTVNTTVNQTSTEHSCYLDGQAGDGTDQTFLTNLYRELFDRDPDNHGFQYWLNYLATNGGTTASGQSNAATRNQVVQIFLHSQEYYDHWVDCAFEVFLGRHVDEKAEQYFVNQLDQGASQQSVLASILVSPEFYAHPGRGDHGHEGDDDDQGGNGNHTPGAPANTNLAFVDNLYGELLGRGADSASEQAYVNALDKGQLTRAQVVEAFLASPEEARDLLDAPGSTAGAPGTPAFGGYPLAALTGGGWDNLFFQGHLQTLNSSAVDQAMNQLETGTSWQAVEQQLLTLPQYYG